MPCTATSVSQKRLEVLSVPMLQDTISIGSVGHDHHRPGAWLDRLLKRLKEGCTPATPLVKCNILQHFP